MRRRDAILLYAAASSLVLLHAGCPRYVWHIHSDRPPMREDRWTGRLVGLGRLTTLPTPEPSPICYFSPEECKKLRDE